jgi:hypothetical protein
VPANRSVIAAPFCEQRRPYPPRQDHECVGAITPQEQRVVLAEPFFKLCEAGAGLTRFHLADERCFLATVDVEIEVMPRAAETTGATERVSLAVDTERAVELHELALNAVAFATW